ncbi:MAG: hypothetical protein SF339_23625 [Blastocatellia bacterium]|nr:hypothetical protein [Blastocatellia bacterium]
MHKSSFLLISAVLIVLAGSWAGGERSSRAQTTATETTVSTLAGGGFGSNVAARQAPMVLPTGVALDPQERGFYVVDEVNGTSLLRFVNTSSAPVTLAGVTIQPNGINLIGGGGAATNDNINPRDTDLAEITGIAIEGDAIYLTIPAFSALRVINVGAQPITTLGKTVAPATITTVASPNFSDFRGLAIHPTTKELHFIAGRLVLKLDATGMQAVVAGGGSPSIGNGDGGPANRARLVTPIGIVFDLNNNLLIADGGDARDVPGAVRRINTAGTISSIAIGLEFPTGITVTPGGDALVALGNAQQIARITPNGVKTTIAGNTNMLVCDTVNNPTCGDGGPAIQANLSIPDSTANKTLSIAADARGLYLPDFRYKRMRFINLSGSAATIAGTSVGPQAINTVCGSGLASPYDGTAATSAELFVPTGVAVDSAGNLFIADTGNNRLRFVNRTAAPVTLFLTTPFATVVQPGQIVTLNRDQGDPQLDDRITTAVFLSPQGLHVLPRGVLIVDSQAGALIKVPPTSVTGRRSGVVRFLNTSNTSVVFFPQGGEASVTVQPGEIKDIAGVRPPTNPQILGDGLPANRVAFFPTDVTTDRLGNLYIADQGNNRVRRIDAQTGIVSTAYGDGAATTLSSPTGIAFDTAGRLHIADTRNNRIIRQNAASGTAFSILADLSRGVSRPRDLTIDNTGKIFFTNSATNQVMELDAPDNNPGTTGVVAGQLAAGFSGDDGPGLQARFSFPNPGTTNNDIQVTTNIITLPSGDMLVTDTGNNRIRLLKRKFVSPPVVAVSAASFLGIEMASESIGAAFGERLSTGTLIASGTPLPTSLLGTTVKLRDAANTERTAPLFFVAPTQINLQVPAGTIPGPATILVTSGDGSLSTGIVNIASVSPGLFTANASGQGVAAAVVLRVAANGAQSYESLAQFDPSQSRFVPIPIDLGPAGDQVFLILYGTGFRFRATLSSVLTTIGGTNAEALYAGPADGFVGLDQANIRLPRSLAGRGLAEVLMTVDGKAANTVTVQIK